MAIPAWKGFLQRLTHTLPLAFTTRFSWFSASLSGHSPSSFSSTPCFCAGTPEFHRVLAWFLSPSSATAPATPDRQQQSELSTKCVHCGLSQAPQTQRSLSRTVVFPSVVSSSSVSSRNDTTFCPTAKARSLRVRRDSSLSLLLLI